MFGNLLIKSQEDQNLEDFVEALPDLIGCNQWEERESSNYYKGQYFRSLTLGFQITVSWADDNEFGDYSFRITFESEGGCVVDETLYIPLADTVARKLTLQGYEVIRPKNIARKGSGVIAYRLNPDKKAKFNEKILTEEI